VFHVLQNVDADAKQNPRMKAAIDAEWASIRKTRPDPKIFWEFIYEERNNVLKEYKLGAGQSVTIHVPPAEMWLGDRSRSIPSIQGQVELSYPMQSGPFKGMDQRDVVAQAIEWLEKCLMRIDAAASV